MGIKEKGNLDFFNLSAVCHELLNSYIFFPQKHYVIPCTVTEARGSKEDWAWSL